MSSEWATARAPSTASGEQQALAPSVSGIGPELQGHAEDLGPALALEQGGDGAVDAAGHRDEDAAGPSAASARDEAAAASQRPVQRVGGELRRVALGRRQASDRLVDLVGPNPSRLDDRLAVDHLGDRRGGGPGRAASLGVEVTRGDPPLLDRAARPGKDPRRRRPPPRR